MVYLWVWQIVLDWWPLITKGSCLSIREMCQVCVLAGCAGWLVGHGEVEVLLGVLWTLTAKLHLLTFKYCELADVNRCFVSWGLGFYVFIYNIILIFCYMVKKKKWIFEHSFLLADCYPLAFWGLGCKPHGHAYQKMNIFTYGSFLTYCWLQIYDFPPQFRF